MYVYCSQKEQRRCCLKLNDLMPSDSGNYTCVVSNRHGELRHTYILDVFCMLIARVVSLMYQYIQYPTLRNCVAYRPALNLHFLGYATF